MEKKPIPVSLVKGQRREISFGHLYEPLVGAVSDAGSPDGYELAFILPSDSDSLVIWTVARADVVCQTPRQKIEKTVTFFCTDLRESLDLSPLVEQDGATEVMVGVYLLDKWVANLEHVRKVQLERITTNDGLVLNNKHPYCMLQVTCVSSSISTGHDRRLQGVPAAQ